MIIAYKMANDDKIQKRTTGAQYIINFFNSVQLITHWYANYDNYIIELKNKFGDDEDQLNKITPEEKDLLRNYCNTIRYNVTKSYIEYNTLLKQLKQNEDQDIKNQYEKIKETYIIQSDDLKDYTISMNNILVGTIIKDLLESSQQIINDLYGEEETQNNEQPKF